jgi:light-regulated signal transduction histidine kinase (bacteriophytochrome)
MDIIGGSREFDLIDEDESMIGLRFPNSDIPYETRSGIN